MDTKEAGRRGAEKRWKNKDLDQRRRETEAARRARWTKSPPPLAEVLRGRPLYQPRTKLGKRLWELRSQIVASGMRLLDWNEIEREVAERRESARAENK
jgi:hypothetical protein